jgi:uncharacterized membrane protein YkgB
VTEHDATPVVALAASVQVVAEKEPEPFEEKLTVPVGVLTVPALVSVTVAVQVLATPVATLAGLHSIVVVVVRVVTVSGLLPELLT